MTADDILTKAMDILMEPPNSRPHGLSSGVVKRFEKLIKSESVPVLEKIVTWTNLLSFVSEAEDLLLDDEKNQDLGSIHRGLTETSIVLGESLLREDGLEEALKQLSVTRDDFAAKIKMLRYKDRMWHGDLDSEKSDQVLKSLFSGRP